MAEVDVVVVSYNSSATLRAGVQALAAEEDFHVVVVDNASSDGSAQTVGDLPLTLVELPDNRGFAHGCNVGWRRGSAPAVLFLNPDARIEAGSVRRLAESLDEDASIGAVGPAMVDEDGSLEPSLRRFPRLRSTYARAFFLHRLLPHAPWTDEVVRDQAAYAGAGPAEWLSGACVLVRRSVLEEIGGWDEGFFLYSEDTDLCRRVWDRGYSVRFDPRARAVHIGGVSAPRDKLLPLLAANRLRYARLHFSPTRALLERLGVLLGELTHAALSTKGRDTRAGHLEAARVVCSRDPDAASRSASSETVQTTVEPSAADD